MIPPVFQVCDLHIHSLYSDSDSSLENIFKTAQDKELTCISITDHDTISGYEYAQSLAVKYDIRLLVGLEISAQEDGAEIHILGYGVDIENTAFTAALDQIKIFRRERILAMADKLNNIGISVDKEEFLNSLNNAIPTRLHLGKYLVDKGTVKDLKAAFKQYLAPKCPAYVARFKYSTKEAIALIQSAGGVAVAAHPHMLPSQELITRFVDYGLDGIEVCYPHFTLARTFSYQNLADKLGLLKTGGSDAHGTYKEYTRIGAVTVPYEWVEIINARVKQRMNRINIKNEEHAANRKQ